MYFFNFTKISENIVVKRNISKESSCTVEDTAWTFSFCAAGLHGPDGNGTDARAKAYFDVASQKVPVHLKYF